MEYLSPSSVRLFYENLDQFYMFYLSPNKPPRPKQTQPMSIGSAFDAYVKNYLHEQLFGKGADPRYDLRRLFDEQVEEHNREWAWDQGAKAFVIYKNSGALADLALELKSAIGTPRFETAIKGLVSKADPVQGQVRNVSLLGKPDLFFLNQEGYSVILDWKVNGWCSKSGQSPKKGYIRLRHSDGSIKGSHKHAHLMVHHGMMINVNHKLEEIDKDWASQLAIYGWLCGQEVGSSFITCIDQLACRGSDDVRIAQHRLLIGRTFQEELFDRLCSAWEIVHSDHIFRELSRAESYDHCKMLDLKALAIREMYESGSLDDNMFLSMVE